MQPFALVHVPESVQFTCETFGEPSYPVAQVTLATDPYVVALTSGNANPVCLGPWQSIGRNVCAFKVNKCHDPKFVTVHKPIFVDPTCNNKKVK